MRARPRVEPQVTRPGLTHARCVPRPGYRICLKLLRCGASVIATTCFPHDAARRYDAEPDADEWRDRVHVYGVDLRDIKGIEEFVAFVKAKCVHATRVCEGVITQLTWRGGWCDSGGSLCPAGTRAWTWSSTTRARRCVARRASSST